jgi:hypothetical protein
MEVKNRPERGYCIVASSSVAPDAPVAAIPLRLALSFDTQTQLEQQGCPVDAKVLRALRQCKQQLLSRPDIENANEDGPVSSATARLLTRSPQRVAEALSLALVVHERFVRRDSSFWAPYFACLPQTAAEMGPAHWTSAERSVVGFTGAHIDDQIQGAAAFADAVFEAVLAPLSVLSPSEFPPSVCTEESLRWALAVWRSRAMAPGLATGLGTGALLPFLDFFNHEPGVLSSFTAATLPAIASSAASLPSAERSCSTTTVAHTSATDTVSGSGSNNDSGSMSRSSMSVSSVMGGTEVAIAVMFGSRVGGLSEEGPSEVCINYGSKETEELVLFYGMAPNGQSATARVPMPTLHPSTTPSSTSSTSLLCRSAMLIPHAPPPPELLTHTWRLHHSNLPTVDKFVQEAASNSLRRDLLSLLMELVVAAAQDVESREVFAAKAVSADVFVTPHNASLSVAYHQALKSVLGWHRRALQAMMKSMTELTPTEEVATEENWFDVDVFFDSSECVSLVMREENS